MDSETGALYKPPGKPDLAAASPADQAIYHITHDLRGPVKALGILPDWIEEDLIGPGKDARQAVARHLDDMRTQAQRLDRMLQDLLTYSRIGRMGGGSDSAIDLRALIAEKAAQTGVEDAFVVRVRLGVEAVVAPHFDLGMVILALIDNAASHHDRPNGLITIETMFDGDELVMLVSDDGPGIATQFHETIFGLMTTLKSRDECDTSGVGLALVRRASETLGGGARVLRSGEGGTTFEVRLPAWRAVTDPRVNGDR